MYHKPPSSFVAGRIPVRRAALPSKLEQAGEPDDGTPVLDTAEPPAPAQPVAAPQSGGDSLIGDLLSMDLAPKTAPVQVSFQPQAPVQQAPPGKITLSDVVIILQFYR